jgi:ubiquitin-protein ligase
MASRRLLREFKELKENPEKDLKLKPSEDSILTWSCMFIGPSETPFEDGVFELKVYSFSFMLDCYSI